MGKPETKIQKKILDYLKSLKELGEPIFYERREAIGLSYKKGIPDIYAVYNGIHIEIEVKTPEGELSTMQEKFRDRCKQINILWICARNVKEVEEFIIQLKESML